MSLTFGFTSKKRPTVFYMNHKFNQHSKNNKGCIHWRCVEYARFKCRAKLVTFENKMLENSTPVHTHPTVKSSIAQKCTKSAREQQAYAFDSFRTEDIEKQDEPKNSTLSSPVHSDDTNTEEKKNELQALYNTLDPEEICENTDETSDEEFWKPRNTSAIEKGEKSQFIQRFNKNRAAEPDSCTSKSMAIKAKPETYSPLSSPANSNDMNVEENKNDLQALYNTLSPAPNNSQLEKKQKHK
jgi:hypothetical protein